MINSSSTAWSRSRLPERPSTTQLKNGPGQPLPQRGEHRHRMDAIANGDSAHDQDAGFAVEHSVCPRVWISPGT